jgi:hypothetical protein
MNDKYHPCIAIIMLFLFIGCGSRLPYATTFPLQTQQRMQAAKHWEVLAEDIAAQVKAHMVENVDMRMKQIYLVPKEGTPFEEIFHELLTGKLVGDGVVVSPKEADSLKMEYNTKLLVHSDRSYQKMPFKWTVLGAGVSVARNIADWTSDELAVLGATIGPLADIASSHYGGPPGHKEIIITTTLSDNGFYFMHRSDIYYINDADWWHYVKEFDQPNQEASETGSNGRTFNVVN